MFSFTRRATIGQLAVAVLGRNISTRHISLSVLLAAFALPVAVRAQAAAAAETFSLLGRSSVTFGAGLTGARDASGPNTHTTGEVAWLGFTHWVRPDLAVEISTGLLNADATVSSSSSHTNTITPILFGLNLSPRRLALSPAVRPYISVAAGPYFHNVSDVTGGVTNTTAEGAAGGRVAVGTNWFVSRHVTLGMDADYHAIGHFEHRDALTTKSNGVGMSIRLGWAWGGR